MDLTELITEEVVKIPLIGTTKRAILREFVDFLDERGRLSDPKGVYEALLAREDMGSTGLEMGIAIPHCRSEAVAGLTLAAGVSPNGVDFDSLDGTSTRLFFLVLAPVDHPSSHVQVLAEIGELTRSQSYVHRLMESKDVADFIRRFRQ